MADNDYNGFTPDYIDRLLPNQVFVFGSNTLGYHTGGASGTARKKFGDPDIKTTALKKF